MTRLQRLMVLGLVLAFTSAFWGQGITGGGGGAGGGGGSPTTPGGASGELQGNAAGAFDSNIAPVVCTVSALSKGKICISSTGNRPAYGYNGLALSNVALASDIGSAAGTAGIASVGDVQQNVYTYAAGAGSANAYTVTLSPAPSLVAGSRIAFKVAADNTAASTIAVNGGSAITIKKATGSGLADLAAGDLKANLLAACVYDGTFCQLQIPVANTTTSTNDFVTGPAGVALSAFVQNATRLFWFPLTIAVNSPLKISYNVSTADNTANLYDIGLFDAGGNLLCHIGATAGTTFSPSTGAKTLSFLAGCGNLTAGARYYFGTTTNCSATCAQIFAVNALGTGSYFSPVSTGVPAAGNVTAGGALNSSSTPPADNWVSGAVPVIALHQ